MACEGPNIPRDAKDSRDRYRAEGFSVDDENKPAPKNIMSPTTNTNDTREMPEYCDWGWDGVDLHRQGGNTRHAPDIIEDPIRPVDENNLLFSIFLLMLPWKYINQVVLVETSKKLKTPLTCGEFVVFIGLWLLMARTEGNQRSDWWSSEPVKNFDGAPYRFHDFMSA